VALGPGDVCGIQIESVTAAPEADVYPVDVAAYRAGRAPSRES
jgi:hypothetical protein